jgi:hypothetical protein
MKKYKIIGLSEKAKNGLIYEHLILLKSFIGCIVEESEELAVIDETFLIETPDGETCHRDFLILKEL